jgi:hypothetical protein
MQTSQVRFPSLDHDFWELESGEERQREHPEFDLPDRSLRANLRVGQLVKLLFRLEGEEEDGSVAVQVERMWVRTTEVVDPTTYMGVLENEPSSYDDPDAEVYLALGAEVPFSPEHIIEVGPVPGVMTRLRRQVVPTRRWPRTWPPRSDSAVP